MGILDLVQLERRRAALEVDLRERTAQVERELAEHHAAGEAQRHKRETEMTQIGARLMGMRQALVITEETAVLQEVGVYVYQHPLDDSVAYQAELARIRDRVKAMTMKDGGAISGSTSWTVNGSAAQGRTMVRDFSKLMLRAYNAEADNLVRGLKPYKLATARDRLDKVAQTIQKLGKTMDITISVPYHRLRLSELELTADYLEKVAEEKIREKEERERLREERKVQQEIERERARLAKEQQHYRNALAALEAKGDLEGAARLRAQLAEIDSQIAAVDFRAANVRAGYVYVISNIGSFGEGVIKVGMTRRLEPMDRVRELSDASVPFNFDVHALFFSDDAVGIEAQMHRLLATQRVNHVNLRREFFYATPTEAKEHLLALTGDLLQFEEQPEAIEFRQSRQTSAQAPHIKDGTTR